MNLNQPRIAMHFKTKRSMASCLLLSACALPPISTGTSGGSVSTPPPVTMPAMANAPRTDADYRRIEREVLIELNAVRSNPSAYAAHLQALLPYFNGNLLRRPGSAVAIRTRE